MTLRRATEDDFAPLTILWAEGWDAGHAKIAPAELRKLRTAASFHQRLRNFGDDLLVIGERGDPTGFIALKPDQIDQFYIRQDKAGSGLASELMALAEAELAARGTKQAKLEVMAENARACAFYRKTGWEEVGIEDITVDTSKGPYVLPAMILSKTLG